ncbi:MAG: 5'/3'-nucleotidase SurE [Bacillota bacterium]
MRILLSNDDGIHARGLRVLVDSLNNFGEVLVVAPDRERSATGHSITVHRPLRVKKTRIPGFEVQSWAVDGTPADCVKLAVEDLLTEPPDLVVSGINQGPNLGTDVLYSGTVSAAIEGAINGFPSVAVSLASYCYQDFSRAGAFIRKFIPLLVEAALPRNILLNVNIPGTEHPRGVKITRLGNRRYVNIFEKRVDPRGRTYYWMAGEPLEEAEGADGGACGTDVDAVKNGYISITPLQLDLTDYGSIEKLKSLFSPG